MARKTTDQQMAEYLQKNYMQQDGTALIKINLYDDFELYDPLTIGETRRLNQDIYDLVDREANLIPPLTPLRICFCCREISPDDQDRIRHMFYDHYQADNLDKVWDRNVQFARFWRMFLFGLVMMALYIVKSVGTDDNLFLEVLSVLASFSLWEAADIWLVERRQLKAAREEAKQRRDATIEFSS